MGGSARRDISGKYLQSFKYLCPVVFEKFHLPSLLISVASRLRGARKIPVFCLLLFELHS